MYRVCYLTSTDDFYCRMVLTSIIMLRKYNKTIKITVFVIGEKGCLVDKFAEDLNLDIKYRKSIDKYFCLNRVYMKECEEPSVLHIDGDTFIFGDVQQIFENHKNVDFAAATDDWITSTPDWDQVLLDETFSLVGGKKVEVFNGGITLWNNGNVKGWCDYLPAICRDLVDKKLPVCDWLYGGGRDCYHRETFAICLYVGKQNLSYDLMGRKEVVNLFSAKDFQAWNVKDYIIYHCFTQNWEKFNAELRRKTVKPHLIKVDKVCQTSYKTR